MSDSEVLRNELQSAQIQLGCGENEDTCIDDESDQNQDPWQTGVYEQLNEEGEMSEAEISTQPRRSTRIRKQNPKYANAAIIEEANANEPETYEESSQHPK